MFPSTAVFDGSVAFITTCFNESHPMHTPASSKVVRPCREMAYTQLICFAMLAISDQLTFNV
jgi:hypothetical protein